MGELEWNHNKRNSLLGDKQFFERLRIEENVEFCSRCDIANSNGPTHHHNLGNFGLDFGVLAEKPADVGSGSGVSPHNGALLIHYHVSDDLERVLNDSLVGRGRQQYSSQSTLPMHMFC